MLSLENDTNVDTCTHVEDGPDTILLIIVPSENQAFTAVMKVYSWTPETVVGIFVKDKAVMFADILWTVNCSHGDKFTRYIARTETLPLVVVTKTEEVALTKSPTVGLLLTYVEYDVISLLIPFVKYPLTFTFTR